MTQTALERIAVVENEVKTVKKTVEKIETNQARNHADIAERIDRLTTQIDGRFVDHEARLKVVEDTTEPFTKFRRRLWGVIVISLLSIATVSFILMEVARFNTTK